MLKKFVCTATACCLPVKPQHGQIVVHNAYANNLKGVCFALPKNRLVAVTGLSGSGKSSIAIDVLASECVRQLLSGYGLVTDHIPKARVGTILGLSPAITISQRTSDGNPRSTVGTRTGILTILRNLFATIGHQLCGGCGARVTQPWQGKHKLTTIEVEEKGTKPSSNKKRKRSFFACPECGEQLETLQMSHFSFNAASGVCQLCKGMGHAIEVDVARLFDEDKPITKGGVKMWNGATAAYYARVIEAASKHYNFHFDSELPIKSYTSDARDYLMYGATHPDFVKRNKGIKAPKKARDGKFEGVVSYVITRYKGNPEKVPDSIRTYVVRKACFDCNNARLGKVGREVTIGGKTIIEVSDYSLTELLVWLQDLEHTLSQDELQVFASFSSELIERTANVIEIGLHYLSLSRSIPSLSAGEAQRLRLAAALGSSALTGVLYILDEPTTGLHPHDTAKLVRTLRKLQVNDNTVLVIEHDLEVIRSADYVLDVGPGRGTHGGQIVASGAPAELMACSKSVTGRHLASQGSIKIDARRVGNDHTITVRGAREHNLQDIDVSIPTQQLVVLTGVSGSGKSTLLFGILDKVARNRFNRASEVPGAHSCVEGLDAVNRVVTVNQLTIGRSNSSRSNVATYTKLFDLIRELFAALPEARKRNYTAQTFSFNVSEQCCENCNGAGVVHVDMAFMPGVEATCPTCGGMRFNDDLRAVKFRGHTISEILGMTVGEAIEIFEQEKKIVGTLRLMKRVGLEHVVLGQSTSTLSGGEAQRIRLVTELSKTGREKTLYLLDEPTTGLHPEEVAMLIDILKELVAKGNTVVAIEHNIEAMCSADTIIDFGPGGGTAGGKIIAQGTPQEVAAHKTSLTGQCLRDVGLRQT